ncbi:MAG: sensor histidine kinase [Solirubrobacteraceae bacterium]
MQRTASTGWDSHERTLRRLLFAASAGALLAVGVLYLASHDPHFVPDLLLATLVGGLLTLALGTFAILARRLRNAIALDETLTALVALLWRQKAHLQSELSASTRDLEVSRRRLLDATVSERQRIQRDLHDSAQQHLVGMRVKLGLAQSSLGRQQAHTERLLAGIQAELDAALQEVRSLANGVYPAVLTQYGLAGALKAACRRSCKPVSLQTHGLTRYAREFEGAVYFTCVEALQNSEKHAGRDARTSVHVWQDCERLRFVVRDSGSGFDRTRAEAGTGLLGMRDRIEAVGGTLTISSAPGAGAIVAGDVPLRGARRTTREK